ncbi:MAG: arpA protein [Actinomycetota bacterium]|nr:arpA protein [Actinomycetota bacterium]
MKLISRGESRPLGDLVHLEKYPLDDPSSEMYRTAVSTAREQLAADGCTVVKDLVSSSGIELLNQEITSQKGATHFSNEKMNPYFHFDENPDFPADHPINTFLERSSGFIPGDSWSPGGPMNQLFRSRELIEFVAACLQVGELHCYADPLAGLTSNILEPGQLFTWHFDTNDFAVTVLVQPADEGGLFEYVPGIRTVDDEGFDSVADVLRGDRSEVTTLDLRPGDLQIFRGRHSLHQVTRVATDSVARHAAIFAYTEQPGVIGRVARTTQLFGRVLPEHIAAEEQRIRGDRLVD